VTSRKIQALRTKKRLFDSAVVLMDDHGYDNVTIEDISNKAGVSVGAFYHYYNSKSDIIAELYVKIDEYFKAEVAPRLGDDVSENIQTFLECYADYNSKQGYEHVRLLFETQTRLFVDKKRYMYVLFKQILERGRDAGQLTKRYSIEYIEDYLLVLARGVIFDWIIHEGIFDLKERTVSYVNMLELIFREDKQIFNTNGTNHTNK
jgi:AcrR family transcriptional regulator